MNNIEIKSANGITLVPLETHLFSKRCLFLEGEITSDNALEFVKKIILLYQEDKDKPIYLFLNGPGGEINAGLVIYDIITSANINITTICCGKSYSMSALLFIAGTNRYMLENSELMIHQPLLGGKITGNTSEIQNIAENMIETKEKIDRIIAKHTKGKTVDEIKDVTKNDTYFSAKEAVKFGLADRVVSFKELLEVI